VNGFTQCCFCGDAYLEGDSNHDCQSHILPFVIAGSKGFKLSLGETEIILLRSIGRLRSAGIPFCLSDERIAGDLETTRAKVRQSIKRLVSQDLVEVIELDEGRELKRTRKAADLFGGGMFR